MIWTSCVPHNRIARVDGEVSGEEPAQRAYCVVGGGIRTVCGLVQVRPDEGAPIHQQGSHPVERGHSAHASAEIQQEETAAGKLSHGQKCTDQLRSIALCFVELLSHLSKHPTMTTPFENPSKIANNVKSGKWTGRSDDGHFAFATARTPLMVAAGVGAAAWYMLSKRDHNPVAPDRDARAPPSKMK
ncbi:hypothetical protein P3T76_002189 [Phytophthora citrophthora]|uniref:Uncharacterized protein n=1 Tax=Phytophthora citrophthora TaxID=4793 RepID=A0AAD9GXM7_9STRA|nr:hypothetical protein P3T76_002189 [Phytophthora citrophthora]